MSRPYGLWESPISPRSLAEDRRLESLTWDSDGQTLVWLEVRSGRGGLVAQQAAEAPRDLTPTIEVRGEVGYGGGEFTVHRGIVYFAGYKTGRLFRQPLAGGPARAITPAFGKPAAPAVSPDGRYVVYVHSDDGCDRLAVVDSEGRAWPSILVEGHDFFMQPRFSPDGRRLAWIAWDHPRMPWDGSELYVAGFTVEGGVGRIGPPRRVAGGAATAVFQPEFSPDGRTLYFISDETGWGRIAAMDLVSGQTRWLTAEGQEYGTPAWVQGMRTYAVSPDGRSLVAARNDRGLLRVERIDAGGGASPIAELAQYTDVAQISFAPSGRRVVLIGSSPTIPPRIVECDLIARQVRVVARASSETVPPEALAVCAPLEWPSGDGTAHGLYYPPAGESAEAACAAPLVVLVHGGPTSQARAGWNSQAQFFATRGYAVLAVNYRGSTGYGREYMLALRGRWGQCDVEDAVSGARHLAATGRADGTRMAIMGGSAGGFTVLQTIIDQPDVFAAGICMYGVANQFHLAADTHKFEAHYLDSLLGPLPEAAAVYHQRSPEFHADRIRRPLALFHGADDRAVPREQSDAIAEALRRNKTPHVYHVYEGEGHGWRKPSTIEHFYETVEQFLREHVLFGQND